MGRERWNAAAFAVAVTSLGVSAVAGTSWTFGWFSGDAIVHIAIAERAAAGGFFELNSGEPSGASSSPLWTLLGAVAWKMGGVGAYVVLAKGAALLSWLVVAACVFDLARHAGAERRDAWLGVLVAIGLPGSVWNWHQGSENGVFAALVLAQMWLLARVGLARVEASDVAVAPESSHRSSSIETVALFALAGLAMALRPEGVVPAAVVTFACWRDGRALAPSTRMRRVVLGVCIAAACALPAYALHHAATGEWLPASGISRVMFARRQPDAISVLGLWFYPRALVRVLAYAPLVIAAIAGVCAARNGAQRILVPIVATFALGLALYTFAVGAAHTGRYLIWSMALLAVPAAVGLGSARRSTRRTPRVAAALGMLWVVAAVAAELATRAERQGGRMTIAEVLAAPAARAARTDAVLAAACAFACCDQGARPALAITGIEERFLLDDRVVIRSLDGAGPGARGHDVRYRSDGCPRVDDLFHDRSVVAFLEAPNGSAFYDCRYDGPVGMLAKGWSHRRGTSAPAPRDWAWVDAPGRMLVRDCRPR